MSLVPYLFDGDWTQHSDVEHLASRLDHLEQRPLIPRLSDGQLQDKCQVLEGRVGQLNLVVEALVRMAVSNGTIKPKELAELMQGIDREDGEEDGQYNELGPQAPQGCPRCEARIPAGMTNCVFCGLRFEDGIDHIRQFDESQDEFEHIPDWCPDCEARIAYGNTACTFCGTKF